MSPLVALSVRVWDKERNIQSEPVIVYVRGYSRVNSMIRNNIIVRMNIIKTKFDTFRKLDF